MPVALTEEEKTLRQLALMNELTKQNKPIPKAFMGLNLSNIPNLDQRIQDAIAANQANTVPSLETTTTPTTVDTAPVDTTPADTTNVTTQTGQTINTPFGNITIPPGGFVCTGADTLTGATGETGDTADTGDTGDNQ